MKKEVVLLIEDSVYEKFMGMVSLCPQVEVVSETMDGVADLDADYCMACANNCPQKAIKLPREANANARYRHPKITLQEIVRANQQHG